MASEIEKLLTEQKTTSTTLEILKDMDEYAQDTLLEQMLTNESLDKGFESENKFFSQLNSAISSLPLAFADLIPENNNGEVNSLTPQVTLNPNFMVPEIKEIVPIANLEGVEILNASLTQKFDEIIEAIPAELVQSPIILDEKKREEETQQAITTLPSVIGVDNLTESLDDYTLGVLKELQNISQSNEIIAKAAMEDLEVKGALSTEPEKLPDTATESEGLLGGLQIPGLGKLGGAARGLLKGVGIAALAVQTATSIYEGFEVFNNDDKIKEIGELGDKVITDADRSSATLASAFENFTFGFLDATETFKSIKPVVNFLQNGIDSIFDPDTGILASATNELFSSIENFSEGDILSGFKDLLVDLPMTLVDVLWDGIQAGLSSVFELLPDRVQETITKKIKSVTDFGEGIAETASNIKDSVTGFFGFGDEGEQEENLKVIKQNNKEVAEIVNEKVSPINAVIPQDMSVSSIPARKDNSQSVANESKKIFMKQIENNKTEKSQQPIIINQSSGGDKAKVSRTASNPDTRLAMLNSGLMD